MLTVRKELISDRFCTATKIVPDRAFVHIQERLWRRDFCAGAKVRHAKEKSYISDRYGVHTLPDSFFAATKIITNKASVHIQEQLWRRDFCGGAKRRCVE